MLGSRVLGWSLLASVVSAALAAPSAPLAERWSTDNLPDLLTATLDELAAGLDSGAFTSLQLIKAYLARIEEVNNITHAVIETNPYALAEAAKSDSARKAGKAGSSPLYGIPILIKDNIATARPDQTYMNTTAGSYALVGSVPPSDAPVAAKLKAAGAIILGKANLSQWANFRSNNSTNGWSSRGGQTTAAYWPYQDPSGSSSGSGVASSIGLAAAALGTETSGSILSPGQVNNLCAIKPSVGLTSRHLVIPISEVQDTVGPMARDCKTAAQILHVIAGKDPNDNYTSAIPFDTIPDYAAACTADGLKGAKIGVPSSFITGYDTILPEIEAFNASFDIIRSLGATVQLNTNFPALAQLENSTDSDTVLYVDFVKDLADYLALLKENPENIHNLQQLAKFTETYPAEDYPDRDIAVFESSLNIGFGQDSAQYQRAKANDLYLGGEGSILGALDKYNLDALILPTSYSPGVAAIAGYPVITVPLGFYPKDTPVVYNDRGTLVVSGPNTPFGISFLGRRFSEEKLVKYACAFEAKTQVRNKGVQPYLIPNVNLKDFVQ